MSYDIVCLLRINGKIHNEKRNMFYDSRLFSFLSEAMLHHLFHILISEMFERLECPSKIVKTER